jgi:hypothetical protein
MYKKTILFFLVTILLTNCAPIPKFELPLTGDPSRVIYKREAAILEDKMINYENLINKCKEISPDSKMVLDDKSNCYFQMTSYFIYQYKGHDHKFSCLFSFQGENKSCSLMINRIKILHYDIEHMYLDDKRRTVKHFNPVYEQINNKVNSLLDELIKQLK